MQLFRRAELMDWRKLIKDFKPERGLTLSEHHECEVFEARGQSEGGDSNSKWISCSKNPGHQPFICAQEFKHNYIPLVRDGRSQDKLHSWIGLAVRLRVGYTSPWRSEHDPFFQHRGTSTPRMGSGWVNHISAPILNELCPCSGCKGGKRKKHWRFQVRTANHVVFDTIEAKETLVDFFYDDESCHDSMASVSGVTLADCDPDRDWCHVMCVTCDEELGRKIESCFRCFDDNRTSGVDLTGLDLLPPLGGDCEPALIISHPHGQPKKITMGVWQRYDENGRIVYSVPTCAGSSGALVIRFRFIHFYPPVHSGSFRASLSDPTQHINFGFEAS